MKTMIEVGKGLGGRSDWIALDKIDTITSYPDCCEIWVDDNCYDYPGPIEGLAKAIESVGNVCGEMRFIGLKDQMD